MALEITDINSTVFEDILEDIESESCVLIIGPDLANFGDKTFFEQMCDELKNDSSHLIDLSPQYVFLHEELLQMKPTAPESRLIRRMVKFYKDQTQFDEPFQKITRMPFHLIVSFLPDDRLKKTYEAQGMAFEYNHYPREENPKPVNKPSRQSPLVYNILGDFNDGDAIITFDHLFEYLSGIMGKRELPLAIQEAFRRARTFIFLGVHFERWYVQLILRIITMKEKQEKYSILRSGGSSEVYAFMARRLELEFMETEPIDFLNRLYDACASRKLLKVAAKSSVPKVFISYSHQDKAVAFQVEKLLKQNSIDVMIDERSMTGGQKITEYIQTIKRVDCVLAIISKDSLLSPWVTKEILMTIDESNKYLLPCYLDQTFMDEGFVEKAGVVVDEKIADLLERIKKRGRANVEDLNVERSRWSDYINELPRVLRELNSRRCISLQGDGMEENLNRFAADIIKNK